MDKTSIMMFNELHSVLEYRLPLLCESLERVNKRLENIEKNTEKTVELDTQKMINKINCKRNLWKFLEMNGLTDNLMYRNTTSRDMLIMIKKDIPLYKKHMNYMLSTPNLPAIVRGKILIDSLEHVTKGTVSVDDVLNNH